MIKRMRMAGLGLGLMALMVGCDKLPGGSPKIQGAVGSLHFKLQLADKRGTQSVFDQIDHLDYRLGAGNPLGYAGGTIPFQDAKGEKTWENLPVGPAVLLVEVMSKRDTRLGWAQENFNIKENGTTVATMSIDIQAMGDVGAEITLVDVTPSSAPTEAPSPSPEPTASPEPSPTASPEPSPTASPEL